MTPQLVTFHPQYMSRTEVEPVSLFDMFEMPDGGIA